MDVKPTCGLAGEQHAPSARGFAGEDDLLHVASRKQADAGLLGRGTDIERRHLLASVTLQGTSIDEEAFPEEIGVSEIPQQKILGNRQPRSHSELLAILRNVTHPSVDHLLNGEPLQHSLLESVGSGGVVS